MKRTVRITEDFPIPGTDIVLEAGDRVRVTEMNGTFRYIGSDGKEWQRVKFGGYDFYLSKIDSTHFFMTTDPDSKYRPAARHVGEFSHDRETFNALKMWLSGKEMIGGKEFNERTTTRRRTRMTEASVTEIIKDFIETNWSNSQESAGKAVNLLKGLAFSDDEKAKKFIKDLDELSNTMNVSDYE